MSTGIRLLVIVLALFGALFCFSGLVMVADFNVMAPPELLPLYRTRANQWLSGTVALLLVAGWQAVVLWRKRRANAPPEAAN